MTPTQRTLKLLRDLGYLVGVTEKWVPQARKRQDLFGFADLAAVHPAHPATLYVQTTSGSNHASRRTKLQALSSVEVVKAAGNRVQIISWRRSARSRRWEPRIEEV
jgi:hypothetical protein